jgi:predicted oxidoreductase
MAESTLATRNVPLGTSGIEVFPLAWGMWRFRGQDLTAARALVDAAFEIGVNLFDTADIYGPDNGEAFGAAEELLGRVFAEAPGLRDRMVLASKAGIEMGTPYNSSKAYLVKAVDASLARLQTDRLDLFQIHRPDLMTHPAEVAEALTALRDSGKVREVGVSNHTAAQTAALQAHLPFALVSHQPEFSPLAIAPLSDGILDQAMERRMAVLAWSPLGGGRLGRMPSEPRAMAVYETLARLAAREGVSVPAVAYAWIMAHPSRAIPIVGSQDPSRIREAADALRVRLSRQDWYDVLVASRGERMP